MAKRDGQKDLEVEFAAERAAALGRIGRKLEAGIAELTRLRAEAAGAMGDARDAILARYREARATVLRYRWYLSIQREAVGIRDEAGIDLVYRIPPDLTED